MTRWVDYKALRETLDFREVLADCGVEVTVKGDQATGFCPLPGHSGRSERKSKSFSVNLKKGIFQCFGCQAKGNVLDFAALMEGLDPTDKEQFRLAALKLQERYVSNAAAATEPETPREREPAAEGSARNPDADLRRVVNAPLDFELKKLDAAHPYLRARGLARETIAHFGLGYCDRGLMKGRVAIPLHDTEGRLIGYAGRLVDDKQVDGENPKYKLPGNRTREGVVYEFSKSAFLFNGHQFAAPVSDLVVVEGFFGTFWLHQHGYHHVAALMGSSCSERQAELLVELLAPDGYLWVMPDGDDAGDKCAQGVLAAVSPHRFVRWVRLEKGQQPDTLSGDELAAHLGESAGSGRRQQGSERRGR